MSHLTGFQLCVLIGLVLIIVSLWYIHRTLADIALFLERDADTEIDADDD